MKNTDTATLNDNVREAINVLWILYYHMNNLNPSLTQAFR